MQNGWVLRCGVSMYTVEVRGNGDKANMADKADKAQRNQGGIWAFTLIL